MSIANETTSRPGLQAWNDSVRFGTDSIVSGLRDIVGAKLVAYIGHVSNTRSVREWADGERAPGAEVVQRLRASQ